MSVQDKALLRAISEDRALGSAMLFSHRHENDTPDFHVRVMDAWRAVEQFVLIEAFRGAAKSTLAEEFLLMEGAYGNFHYCLLIGETYAKACQRVDSIAHEARTNIRVRKLFGKVLAKKPIENKIWFESGALIEGIGWEQEIRGYKYHDRRPERAHLDDVETLERVRSTEAVDQTMMKLNRELRPAMDPVMRKIRVTQTPLAADCMVTRLRADPSWVCVSIPVCTGDVDSPETVSNWPSRYPMSWIRKERDDLASAGRLRDFEQEYLLNVESQETKPFSEDMLRSVDVAPAAWLPRKAIYDPARTANAATSCRYGKVVVSRLGSRIIVHESGGYFWKPDECRTDLFATFEKHHCSEVGIEKDSLDEYLLQPIRYECLRRGVVVPIRPLNAPQDRDKDSFIMGLQPFFKAGDVILVGGRGMHPQLVAEIMNFPGGSKDIVNALAYALRMFAGEPVYQDFSEANVAPAREPAVGERLITCWNASAAEVVCAVLLRSGRHFSVIRDFAASGPTNDACRMILAELRGFYPKRAMDAYAPAELHDSFQRIPLVPALRAERLSPYRAEHTVIARGSLAEPIRTTIRERRLLSVAKDAPRTLAALAGDYKYPVGRSGSQALEPEAGIHRLMAEALETTFATLSARFDDQAGSGRHFGTNAQGVRYHTALPQRR